MSWATIFANLAAGNQPLSLFDAMFSQISSLSVIPCTAASNNAIALTGLSNAPTLTAYSRYCQFVFRAAATSTGLVTIAFAALGALKAFRADATTQMGSGDVVNGQMYIAIYDSALDGGAGGFFVQLFGFVPAAAPPTAGAATPGGRLSLVTATPVMTSTASGINNVFYTPYLHQFCPLNVSGTMTMTNLGGELSQLTTDNTKSPAAVANNSNYDMFVWNDGGTFRCTRGPAWTNDTTRGYTLTRVQGMLTNTSAITNGPGAGAGTLVGTIRSNGSALIDWIYGALAANGTESRLCVWNAYNRVSVETFVQDSTDSWAYSTATWRAANNSATMRVSFVQGLSEDGLAAEYTAYSKDDANPPPHSRSCGIGYDSTTALASGCSPGFVNMATVAYQNACLNPTNYQPITAMHARFHKAGDLGFHFISATEIGGGAGGTATWYGDNGTPTTLQNGLFFHGRF